MVATKPHAALALALCKPQANGYSQAMKAAVKLLPALRRPAICLVWHVDDCWPGMK
jgi:hypothetical protein